jgi:hypothetical protein
MIELENNRIGFAATNTRILAQMLKNFSCILLTDFISALVMTIPIMLMIFVISFFPTCFETFFAPRRVSVFGLFLGRKRIQILLTLAFGANFFHVTNQKPSCIRNVALHIFYLKELLEVFNYYNNSPDNSSENLILFKLFFLQN